MQQCSYLRCPLVVKIRKPIRCFSVIRAECQNRSLGPVPGPSSDYVRQNETQGRNVVFFKAHVYCISFCLTWSMDRYDAHSLDST